jgi:hypothetical protein
MTKAGTGCLLALVLASGGCSSHLIFVEESHLGLKASFSGTSTSPYELDLGYRRGIVAMIPQQKDSKGNIKTEIKTAANGGKTVASMQHDPDELTSLFVLFRANVGFDDPIELHHFMATGWAATLLASRKDAIESAQKQFMERAGGTEEKKVEKKNE